MSPLLDDVELPAAQPERLAGSGALRDFQVLTGEGVHPFFQPRGGSPLRSSGSAVTAAFGPALFTGGTREGVVANTMRQ